MPKIRSKKTSSATEVAGRDAHERNARTASSSELDGRALLEKLADNRRPVREKALEVVAQYVSGRKTLQALKLQKLWKGLFYTVWHSDRPLTQQKLVSDLADLTARVQSKNLWPFINAFWTIMAREWGSLDSHRINKFYLLIRRFLAATFDRLATDQWKDSDLAEFAATMSRFPFNPSDPKIPNGLRLHMCDIYLDELEKIRVVDPSLPLAALLAPALSFIAECQFKVCKKAAIENIHDDPRLLKWGIVEGPADTAASEEEDSEWEGFD